MRDSSDADGAIATGSSGYHRSGALETLPSLLASRFERHLAACGKGLAGRARTRAAARGRS